MGAIRQSRVHRGEPGNTRTQERDAWIIEGLSKMRFLTTSQIAKLYFNGSRWASHKRLRKLLDTGLIRVWVRNLSQENVYSLDRAGAKHLMEENELLDVPYAPRGVDRNLQHLLLINEFRIALALHLAEAESELVWWRSDWELRKGAEALVPDALFALRWEDRGTNTFALEADNNTRSPRYFLRKIYKYEALRGYHDDPLNPFAAILVVGRDPKWIERYRACLQDKHIEKRIGFTTFESIEHAPLGEIWSLPNGTQKVSLRTLISLPYGMEDTCYESVVIPTD